MHGAMYFFHERLVQHLLTVFQQTDFANPAAGDAFFGTFAPGNIAEHPDRPYERFSDYEELLSRLMAADRNKYKTMHKGTPFGFMAWLAFDLQNYEKALFYMDAGISEDVRKDPLTWIRNPGPRFLLLDLDPKSPWLRRTEAQIIKLLGREMDRFNQISSRPPMTIADWRRFVERFLAAPTQRTIISALYVFLLEFEDRHQELLLREGSTGGSNQPFTVHLFTGGLLFESLLKLCYPVDGRGIPNKTLGSVLNLPTFLHDFGLADPPSTTAQSLSEIHDAIQGNWSIVAAFSTAAKLRNTTGHNLVWDDIFDTPSRYTHLFRQVINAIFHVISLKFT